ncbi:hypothetical protein PWT90_03485 [Aphanocladium album]|nr:hypothetical protein PWT90_03485 [Aphanocladium album]
MLILFSVSVLFLAAATVLFLTRAHWLHRLPEFSWRLPTAGHLYARLPSTFAGDMEAGLSSSTFDLSGNVEGGDGRAGLDDAAKSEILKIMKKRRLNFDRARQVYMESRFKANGIGPDGRPRDPKFVSFS